MGVYMLRGLSSDSRSRSQGRTKISRHRLDQLSAITGAGDR